MTTIADDGRLKQNPMPIVVTKRKNKITLIVSTAVIAIAIVIAAATILFKRNDNAKAARQNETAVGDTTAVNRKPRPEYEFGAPANVLAERSPMAAAMVGENEQPVGDDDTEFDEIASATQANDGAKAIENRVNTTRAQFEQLKTVHEQYKQMPTQALRDRGKKLKEEVLTGVSGLMPLARRYNYKAGIEEAQAMRRQALEMNFN